MTEKFNKSLLLVARKAVGKTQVALAHEVGASQALLSKIENGLETPTEDLCARLAHACDVPATFFFQDGIVQGEVLVDFFHRKRLTLPAKPLERAHAIATKVRLEVRNLLQTIAFSDVALLPQVASGDELSPSEAAAMARATWRLPSGPVLDLVGLLEAAGVVVISTSLGHEKLSALSAPMDNGSYLVVVNSDLPASMQRFTLAHELGHLVMHYTNLPSMDLEEQANAFASAFLMPVADIAADVKNLQFRQLGPLKQKWRVSFAAIIRCARDLGGISDRQYRTFNIKLNALPGGRKHEPGEFAAESPQLVTHVISHFRRDLGFSLEQVWRIMQVLDDYARVMYLGETRRRLQVVERPQSLISLAAHN